MTHPTPFRPAILALALALGLGLTLPAPATATALAQTAPAQDPLADLPAPLRQDLAGAHVLDVLRARGVQIYECVPSPTGGVWHGREPLATLLRQGVTVGRHFAGPRWELDDGSGVAATVAASAPGATADDVPWLRLSVTRHWGQGSLSTVSTVLRIHTQGGTLSGPCPTLGALRLQPYEADYVFLAP